jgi:release factor glutamine methyltransferase
LTITEIRDYVYRTLCAFEDEREAAAISRRLLEYFTAMDMLFIALAPQTAIDDGVLRQIQAALEDLKNHKPLQYVLGETYFAGLQFSVNEAVLIPRPETEELVYWILHTHPDLRGKIMDVCTGSACLAVSLAVNYPQAQLYAIDAFEKVLALAKSNAEKHKVSIDFQLQDVLSSDFQLYQPCLFDIILSNPPYVRESEKAVMAQKVLAFEPETALFVPDTHALLFYQAITSWAYNHLNEGGELYFEINEAFPEEMRCLLERCHFKNIELKRDMQNKWRMIRAKK